MWTSTSRGSPAILWGRSTLERFTKPITNNFEQLSPNLSKMPPKSKAKVAKIPAVPVAKQASAPRPDWPALTPLSPASDLECSSLLPAQILTIPRLFTSSLSAKYVSFLRSLPLTTTPGRPKRGDAVRVNDRFQIDDPDFARHLWEQTALKELVTAGEIDGETLDDKQRKDLFGGEILGLNPNIRIYRYSEGQFFDQHYDDSNNLMFPQQDGTTVPAKTTWTLLLYLTTCEGGETVFYPDPPSRKAAPPPPVEASPEVGLALLHRHGKECMVHEGREVTKGEKWVVRSDLCVKR
ncbi:hypothetical protein D6D10_06002 [Aureobasidium pullulans]|uniref:Fe2OG dioxygenase domain-containing protein n=2 Tax=Aureobasidium pullulans TaxID=5580 RepID=A0A4S9EU34_AURPU|nr:hypothetical protein D6D10_06002 [Aureobasidium pullulans]